MKISIRLMFVSLLTLLAGCGVSVHIGQPAVPASYDQAVQTTIDELRNYWAVKFSILPSVYSPPSVYSYDSSDDLDCNGEPVDLNNALFCTSSTRGEYIGFDVAFMRNGFEKYGAAWVYFIFAHEYGHAAQHHVSQTQPNTRAFELQADCLGGSFISEMIHLNRLHITQKELNQMTEIIKDLGDDAPGKRHLATPEEGHGTGAQRYDSFYTGFNGAIPACHLKDVG